MSDRPSEQGAKIARLLLTQEVAEFLYREAELLDERRYDDWLGLLADDIRYWMPMRRNVKFGEEEREFTRVGQDIAWFDEGKDTLVRRAVLGGQCQAEVGNLHALDAVLQEDVGRLDVAVHQPLGVGGGQPGGNLQADA